MISKHVLIALPVLALACAADPSDDASFDDASLEIALEGVACSSVNAHCSGAGSVYTAAVRATRNAERFSEVAQTFTDVSGPPASVTLMMRLLRDLPEAESPLVTVALREAPGGVVSVTGQDLYEGTLAATHITRGRAVEKVIALSPIGAPGELAASTTYALVVRVAAPQDGGTALGIAAHGDDVYAGGEASWRQGAVGGEDLAFRRSVDVSDLSFSLQLKTYEAAVLADAPIAYWRLAETSGTSALDASGNGRTGTYLNVVLNQPGALGDLNPAASFVGGGSSHLTFPQGFAQSGRATFELWAKASAPTQSRLLNYAFTGTLNGAFRWGIFLGGSYTDQGTNPGSIGLSNGTITSQTAVGTFTDADAGEWRHIVVTYDRNASPHARFYKNGVRIPTATDGLFGDLQATNLVRVGHRLDVPDLDFVGHLDDVAVYDKVLSDARIQAHYDAR